MRLISILKIFQILLTEIQAQIAFNSPDFSPNYQGAKLNKF